MGLDIRPIQVFVGDEGSENLEAGEEEDKYLTELPREERYP